MDWEFLEPLKNNGEPVSLPARVGWLAFYGIFLLYALFNKSGYLFIDIVFVPIHEGGHLLFSYFGHALMVAGGTILQLGVPLMLAIYFAFQRQLASGYQLLAAAIRRRGHCSGRARGAGGERPQRRPFGY